MRSGYIDVSLAWLRVLGHAHWWSIQANSSVEKAYRLGFNNTTVNTTGASSRWNAFPLRCLSTVCRYEMGVCYNSGIMPELPEVETVRRGLKPFILNKKIIQVKPEPGKGFQGSATEVDGATVTDIRRRGKALLIDLDNGNTLMIHLRMTGQLIWRGQNAKVGQLDDAEQFAAGHPSKNFTAELPNSQTRVNFVFVDGNLYFNDQRKFGFVKVLPTGEVEQDKFIAELAKEPWQMSAEELYAKCQSHGRSPIKAVLLNQKLIAGLGNIYADESLFYASVHPAMLAGKLSFEQIAKILEGACKIMDAAIASGGSTMATYVRPDGSTGDYLERFAQVFRREGKPCPRCGTIIEKTRCAGRGTHFCPKCQGQPPAKVPVEATERP